MIRGYQHRVKDSDLFKLFWVFAKVGALTVGGGYAIILVLKDEVIKRGWITEEEFPDILALSQTAPGIMAVNFAVICGYRCAGRKGALASVLGCCLPSFIIILLIALFFTGYRDNPTFIRIFKGIRPAVVALIAVPMIQMAIKGNHNWHAWLLTAGTLVAVASFHVNPIYVLLASLLVSCSISLLTYYGKKGGEK